VLQAADGTLGIVGGGDQSADRLAHAGLVGLQALDPAGQHEAGDDGGDEEAGHQRFGDEVDRHVIPSQV
jgi:hypothetical protein